jgi:predicted RNase H-like HicB family nuclease
MTLYLLGSIKGDGIEGRVKLYAEKQENKYQIVGINPDGEEHDTEISGKTIEETIQNVKTAWGDYVWDLELSGIAQPKEVKYYIVTKWTKEITDSGKDEVVSKKPDHLPHKFRLLDDDNIVYAYGYSLTNDDEKAFWPLDRYQNDYGCTIIEYYNNGKWEML